MKRCGKVVGRCELLCACGVCVGGARAPVRVVEREGARRSLNTETPFRKPSRDSMSAQTHCQLIANTTSALLSTHHFTSTPVGSSASRASCTPPYSPRFNPIELLFAYLKRYCRKHAPPTTEELVRRLREATEKVTGYMIMGWFLKCGYLIPGADPAQERDPDPNEGVENRCTLPKNAKFQAREHIAC